MKIYISKVTNVKIGHILLNIWFIILGIYVWPLIFKIPKTLWILFEAFRPGGYGIGDHDFWAFSKTDAAFRPWYTKIAKDYHLQGRFGYVWDDGLGMPLGVRIYNNLGTYKLLYWLGHRRMMAVGYALMILATGILVSLQFGLLIGSLAGILTAASPLIVCSYTHYGKPEMFWWAFVIPIIYIALTGNGLWAGLGWSGLAMLNLPVSAMIVLLLGTALLAALYMAGALLGAIIGAIPGIVKNVIRLSYMWRSGFMASLSSEQARLWKRPFRPTRNELLWWFPFVLSVVLSSYASTTPIVGALIIVFGIGVYWFNWRVIYLNDPQSFHMAYWVAALAYASVSQSTAGLLSIFLMIYQRPSACGIPPSANRFVRQVADPWERRKIILTNEMKVFPNLELIKLPQPATIMQFFDQIPNGTRFIAESDGDPRAESRFRAFWQWTEEFLPERQVDLVSETYTRAVEPELVDKYLTPFNAQHMTVAQMTQLCQHLGVSHVVTYTQKTATLFGNEGYNSVANVDLAILDDFRGVIANVPAVELHLFKISSTETVISPPASWERRGNELTWSARSHQSYVIRYRYSHEFKAYQNGDELKVLPVKPMKDLPLQFMQVTAVMDGPVILKFIPHWF